MAPSGGDRIGFFRRWYTVFAAVLNTVVGTGAILFVVGPMLPLLVAPEIDEHMPLPPRADRDASPGATASELPRAAPSASASSSAETTRAITHSERPVPRTVRKAGPLAPSEQNALGNNFYDQIGPYKLSSVKREPSDLGAGNALVADYRTPRGPKLYYYLYSFASSVESENAKEVWVEHLQTEQSFYPQERMSIVDNDGNQLGTGLYLTDSYEAFLWTHGTLLAAIYAERHEGDDFYAHLYGPAE